MPENIIVEVVALVPVALLAELALHRVEELRARQRVRDADADVVGPRALQQVARRENVVELLAEIAEHQEEADADAFRAERAARLHDVVDAGALVHGVENLLAAALGADPDLAAAGVAKRRGHARAHQVRAQLNRERHASAALRQSGREIANPIHAEAEDVVGKPDVVGRVLRACRRSISAATSAADRCR